MPVRASHIDWINTREIYDNLKKLEDVDYAEHPNKVTVTQEGYRTDIVFEFIGLELEHAIKMMNSFFLDRGFKRFHLEGREEGGICYVSTTFVPFVVEN